MHIYKYSVTGMTSLSRADELKRMLASRNSVKQADVNVEKQLLRIVCDQELSLDALNASVAGAGFRLALIKKEETALTESVMTVGIGGMTCRSCELTIERTWKKLPGVRQVTVNAATGQARLTISGDAPSVQALQGALGDAKYRVSMGKSFDRPRAQLAVQRPSFLRLAGLFAIVFFAGHLLSRAGLLKTNFSLGTTMSFGTVFLIGLIAASSSCIAVTGGLLLSAAAKFNKRYASARRRARMRPVLLFVSGRIAGYAVFGGLLGVVGSFLTPSPLATAVITIIAALYMLVMGLDMLNIAPSWLKGLLPRMPKRFAHRMMNMEEKEHAAMPFGLGAATFFLPCGFTQALQLYALTTGSFATGAILLTAFALGTAPALLALGAASSSLKGKTGQWFFQFSGALVIVLGFWNIQNGFTIAGYPLSLPSWSRGVPAQAAGAFAADLAPVENGVQVLKMSLGEYGGYEPDHLVVRAGIPVRWEVDGTNARGCTSVLTSRKLGIRELLKPGINTFAFTPTTPGEVEFSCSMGMVRGSITVLPNS